MYVERENAAEAATIRLRLLLLYGYEGDVDQSSRAGGQEPDISAIATLEQARLVANVGGTGKVICAVPEGFWQDADT